MKIYLLEDNLIFAWEFLKRAARLWYRVSTCYNINDYVFESADLYIIDIQIWNNYSYEIIKRIRNETDRKIIALTHHYWNSEVENKAREAWANYIMDKMDHSNYFTRIETLLWI